MKRKNQIIKRICASLCALVVAVSCLGVVGTYYASSKTRDVLIAELFKEYKQELPFELHEDYVYWVYCDDYANTGKQLTIYGVKKTDNFVGAIYSNNTQATVSLVNNFLYGDDSVKCNFHTPTGFVESISMGLPINKYRIIFSEFDFYYWKASSREIFYDDVRYSADLKWNGSSSYNPSIGYLQNVTRKSTYIRDALYNYDESSLTYHWTHDLITTTGVDLSSGNYKIRHYISKATVDGYEKENIIEMSDKYLVGEYDASDGGFSYLKKDYDDKIAELGYENIGWVDKYLKGYFVLEHNYFQIVNSATNEVGGYLHFYPKDSDGDSFGVEYEYEGLDNDFVVDEDAPSGFIDNQTGSGLTHEEALENAEQLKLDDLGGVDELTANLDAYASQIGGVTNGIGALFGQLPPWIVGLLGLSVALSFAVVVFKVLRG